MDLLREIWENVVFRFLSLRICFYQSWGWRRIIGYQQTTQTRPALVNGKTASIKVSNTHCVYLAAVNMNVLKAASTRTNEFLRETITEQGTRLVGSGPGSVQRPAEVQLGHSRTAGVRTI